MELLKNLFFVISQQLNITGAYPLIKAGLTEIQSANTPSGHLLPL